MSVFNTSGEFVTSFGQFSNPAGVVIDDDFVYVSDHISAGKVYIMYKCISSIFTLIVLY